MIFLKIINLKKIYSTKAIIVYMGGSPGDVMWRACDVGEAKEVLENELVT